MSLAAHVLRIVGLIAYIVLMVVYGIPSVIVKHLRWEWRRVTHRLPYIDTPGPGPGVKP